MIKISLVIIMFSSILSAYTYADRDREYKKICVNEVHGVKVDIDQRHYYEMRGQAMFSKTLSHRKNNPEKKKYKVILAGEIEIMKMACERALIAHPEESYFMDAYSQALLDQIKKD